jgi:hypothetical protein
MPLDELARALERNDLRALGAWARSHAETPGVAVLSATVDALIERRPDEPGRFSEIEPFVRSILRLRALAGGAGGPAEHPDPSPWSYGVLAHFDGAPVALGVGAARPTVVAAAAPDRGEQHVDLVRALAAETSDALGLGRDRSLAPGSIAVADARGFHAPHLASRWRVRRGAELHARLAGRDVVSVVPVGGRFAYAPDVASFENQILLLRRSLAVAGPLAAADLSRRVRVGRVRELRRAFERLDAGGWTEAVEPLTTPEARAFVGALVAHADDAAVLAAFDV